MVYPPLTEECPPGSSNAIVRAAPKKPRPLYRPPAHIGLAIALTLISLTVIAGLGVGAYFLCRAVSDDFPPSGAGWIASGSALLILLFFARKRIPIWVVHVYQHFAPDHMRRRCLYTPSCSAYMILSIEKYGCVRGIIRGIKRLRRCHHPNGGPDWP